ncbi:MAG: glycosyltransferase family 2 protein [Sumerlaeia bacterium]
MVDLSIVITAYNRPKELVWTIESVQAAAQHCGRSFEILVVDDGSIPPISDVIQANEYHNLRILYQENKGSASSRLNGLLESKGVFVFLTDSDDFVVKDKFSKHIELMEKTSADCSYCRERKIWLNENREILKVEVLAAHSPVTNSVDLLIGKDLRSNNLVYKGDKIRSVLANAVLPPHRAYSPSGDHYIYYNLATAQMSITGTDEVLSDYCIYQEGQLSDKRSELAFSALRLNEDFIRSCPKGEQRQLILPLLAERIFKSWRRLPKGTPKIHLQRLEALMSYMPKVDYTQFGGSKFRFLAKIIGPIAAGNLLRTLSKRTFDNEYAVTAQQYEALFESYMDSQENI